MIELGALILRRGAPFVAAVAALVLVGCGGGAKVGDCIGANSGATGGSSAEPKASVVDCKNSQAKARLVTKMSKPLIHCINIDPGTENDYNVSVAGDDFCARPK